MPDHASRNPIHVTPVPLNGKEVFEPASIARTAEPALSTARTFGLQFPVYVTAGASCSMRVVVVPVVPPVLGSEEAPVDNSTINVSIRVAHPNDVSAPNVPSQ